MSGSQSRPVALLDIDGTLVDTNYQHALAWYRAFRRQDLTIPLWIIHRHIGMGGDQLVPTLGGEKFAAERGEAARAAEKEEYGALIEEVQPLPGARRLIEQLKERGHTVMLASSAKEEETEHYVDLLGVRETVDGWTMSADVEATKPEPDIIETAMGKAGGGPAVMLGDSTWDFIAAGRAGVPGVGLLTGGFSREELLEAGAEVVFESLEELSESLPQTPFSK